MCCSGNARDNLFRSPIRSKMKAIQSMSMKIALQCSRCKRVFARQNFFSGICNFSASGVSIHLRHMKCAELLALLNEYVDGTVDLSICEEFEKHMAGCNPCQVVVDNIRRPSPCTGKARLLSCRWSFRIASTALATLFLSGAVGAQTTCDLN